MRRRHRLLVAAGLLAPACSPAPTAHRGASSSASPRAETGSDATAAPDAATSTEPALESAGAGTIPPAPAGPPTTAYVVTVPTDPPTTTTIRPRPLPTTTLPERAGEEDDDATWWAKQPGFVPGACGGSLPPCYVMQRESGGNVHVYNRQGSGASGKWQFMPGTWAGYGGYANAADAPEWVQDEKARQVWAGGRGCFHWDAC